MDGNGATRVPLRICTAAFCHVELLDVVVARLSDTKLEVRELASTTLSGAAWVVPMA